MHPAIRIMRQFTPITNLLLACLAGVGLVVSLGLPWYGSAASVSDPSSAEVGTIAGPIDSTASLVARWFSSEGTVATGADALGTPGKGLLALAAITIVLSVAMLVPVLSRFAKEGLRIVPLAAPALVVLHMANMPGSTPLELRWGIFAALGAGLLMASSAWHGSSLRAHRKAPVAYSAPAAPAASVAPPRAHL